MRIAININAIDPHKKYLLDRSRSKSFFKIFDPIKKIFGYLRAKKKYELFRQDDSQLLATVKKLTDAGHEVFIYDKEMVKSIDGKWLKDLDLPHLHVMNSDFYSYDKSIKGIGADVIFDDILSKLLITSSSVDEFYSKLDEYLQKEMKNVMSPISNSTTKSDAPSKDKPWQLLQHKGDLREQDRWLSPYERFVSANKEFLDETFISDSYFGTSFTYRQIIEKIDLTAKGLRALGIKEGSKVPVVLSSNIEMFIIIEALYKVKATIIPFYPKISSSDLAEKLEDIDYSYIIVHDLFYKNVKTVKKSDAKAIVIPFVYSASKAGKDIYKDKVKPSMGFEEITYDSNTLKYNDLLAIGEEYYGAIDTSYDENYEAIMLFTSGTSSIKPKAVILTGKNLEAAYHGYPALDYPIYRDDIFSCFLPINHVFGLVSILYIASSLGAKFSMIPKFEASKVDDLILKDNTTVFSGLPKMTTPILESEEIKSTNRVKSRLFILGGDKVTDELRQKLKTYGEEHGIDVKVLDGFGQTETTAAYSYNGVLAVGNEVKIVDPETGKEQSYEEPGEIYVKGDNVMKSYNNLSLNAKSFVEYADGKWFKSGDVGYITEDGRLIPSGRLDDQIKINGEKVILSQIAETIKKCPIVKDCVVIDRFEGSDNCIVANIVLNDGFEFNDDVSYCLDKYYEEHIAKKYERPKLTLCYREFPINQTGKNNMKIMKTLSRSDIRDINEPMIVGIIDNITKNIEIQKKN